MSAISGSHRNIREELEIFRSGIKELNNQSKLSGTINGQTYNVEIVKSRLFRIPEVIVRDKKGNKVIRCKIKNFGASKLRHAVLKHQWKEKNNFSMEQRAQLFAEAEGHGVGRLGARVSLTPLVEECLKTAEDSNKPINERGDALLGLCAMYSGSAKVKQNSAVANFLAGFGCEKNSAQEIARLLLDTVKNPSLSTAERDEAGEILAKVYNHPETPRSVKDEIYEAAQAAIVDLCVIALRARLGISIEAARKVVSEHGPVSGVTLQQQTITPNLKAGLPGEPQNTIVYRSYNNVEEQVAAIEAKKNTHNISRHTIEVDGQTLNFWIAKDKAGVSPPSLYLEDPKLSKGSDSELREIINGYKNHDHSTQKEKLDRLLSMADQNGFGKPKALVDSLSMGKSFPFQELGFNPTNGGRVSGEAAGCLPSLKDTQEELQKTTEVVVKGYLADPDSNTLSNEERNNIVKAHLIATGEQKTFDEIVDLFRS
jgi:hypothetical protein